MSNNHSDYLLLHATIEWLALSFGRFFCLELEVLHMY